jgi:hypothetical protein
VALLRATSLRSMLGPVVIAADELRDYLTGLDEASSIRMWLAEGKVTRPSWRAGHRDARRKWRAALARIGVLADDLRVLADIAQAAQRRPSPLRHGDKYLGRREWATQAVGIFSAFLDC